MHWERLLQPLFQQVRKDLEDLKTTTKKRSSCMRWFSRAHWPTVTKPNGVFDLFEGASTSASAEGLLAPETTRAG